MSALITLDWDTLILAGNFKKKKHITLEVQQFITTASCLGSVLGTKKSPENTLLSVLKTHFCDTHELSVNPGYILASFTEKKKKKKFTRKKCYSFFARSNFMKCTTKHLHISKRHARFSPNSLTCYFGYNSRPLKCTELIDSNGLFLFGKSEQRLTWAAEGSVSPLSRFVCVRLPRRGTLLTKLPPTVPPPDPPALLPNPPLTRPKSHVSCQLLSYIFTILSSGVCSRRS